MANEEQLNRIKAGVAGWNAWRDANRLASIDLSGANLSGANLHKADLNHANLNHANLSGANLRGTSMREANLTGADMTDAYLWDTDMAFAIVLGANMRGVNLTRANLGGVLMVGILGDPLIGGKVIMSHGMMMSHDIAPLEMKMEMNLDDDLSVSVIDDMSGFTDEQIQQSLMDDLNLNIADPDPDSES